MLVRQGDQFRPLPSDEAQGVLETCDPKVGGHPAEWNWVSAIVTDPGAQFKIDLLGAGEVHYEVTQHPKQVPCALAISIVRGRFSLKL